MSKHALFILIVIILFAVTALIFTNTSQPIDHPNPTKSFVGKPPEQSKPYNMQDYTK